MDIQALTYFFQPKSIAVIGATNRKQAVGEKVLTNLLQGQFDGELYPVNPKHKSLKGLTCYPSIDKIEEKIDLAIIATPASTVPKVIMECGHHGIKAVVVLSAGFSEMGAEGKALEQSILATASQQGVRLIGPNCLGIMLPHQKLNASFNNIAAHPGHLALVSQSGAICAAILDWAYERQIGFSAMISLGNSADVDFSDILDYLALDSKTHSILLYIEGIRHARHFMSSLRAAARMKPVVVIKGGRFQQGSRAAVSHTGAIVGKDAVFSAALKRAGAVRVYSIDELFSAAQILASNKRSHGKRLAIITNGGGAGVMAADKAAELNLQLIELNETLLEKMNQSLPSHWSHSNPIDILGDATPERYQKALSLCLEEASIDGIVIILVPVAMANPTQVAKEVIKAAKETDKPVIACWMGEHQVVAARQLFAKHQIPYYETPEMAVEAFSYLAAYCENQQLLFQVPEPMPDTQQVDKSGAKLIIESVLSEKRTVLTLNESKAILNAFDIPATQSIEARSANDALIVAESLGFPVAMKIYSPDITHKQDVGGVHLNLADGKAVRDAYQHMMHRAKEAKPEADIRGVTLEKMYQDTNNRELIIGVMQDAVFGPVISFGAGGSFVEVLDDVAVALPPLNTFLAKKLIDDTRVAKLLSAHRNRPAVNRQAIETMLLKVSELVCQLPELQELDLNPVLANDQDVIAADARCVVELKSNRLTPYEHMAIHPYPREWRSEWQTADGQQIIIRPIRPEDATIEQAFELNESKHANQLGWMQNIYALDANMLMRFTQIDYDREMAFIALIEEDSRQKNIGIARYIAASEPDTCEFVLVVAKDWQGKGIGSRLMQALMEEAKYKGLKVMRGLIDTENHKMQQLMQAMDFTLTSAKENTNLVIATYNITN